ncbi:hypothetical protein B0H19DRAFT_1276334 [Mycena capillaripes]|nr:hypothetical protein B0H19DRAFT_1276334 [Mycena capillaripes]
MSQTVGFVALHRGGTLLDINADMKATPLVEMVDALLPTIDIPSVAEEVKDALSVAAIPTSNGSFTSPDVHFSGIPDVSHLPREDQDRIHNFMYMKTSEEVEEFKIWIQTLPDTNGVLPFEAQHKANNVQTGIGMGLVESFKVHTARNDKSQGLTLHGSIVEGTDEQVFLNAREEAEIHLKGVAAVSRFSQKRV